MEKIKPIKPRLGRRIAAAIRALQGELWPAQIVYEPPKIERHNILSFGRMQIAPRHIDEWVQADWDKIQREEIAANLGKDLLQAGAIKITAEPTDPRVYGPFAGTVYRSKVLVAMPTEKEAQE